MARTGRLVCAGGLFLLLLAGCKSSDFSGLLFLESAAAGRDRVVVGSLDAVAQSAQATLTQMGFAATSNRQGETVRIVSRTSSGAAFALVLTRQKGPNGEQTRVHLEWDGPQDDQTGFQILAQLEALSRR